MPKPVLETALITKEATYYFNFGKYFVIRAFSVLLEDSFKIISET
jgi:hypothetical protein